MLTKTAASSDRGGPKDTSSFKRIPMFYSCGKLDNGGSSDQKIISTLCFTHIDCIKNQFKF